MFFRRHRRKWNQWNCERLESRVLLAANPIISEFLASNDETLDDSDGESSDIIEIYNAGDETIDLDGWYLTDNANNLTQWRLPAATLEPKEFLVVFASGKDRSISSEELHTNFSLSRSGEYLALIQPDGETIASEFAPEYPEQFQDISYGVRMGEIETDLVSINSQAHMLVPLDDRYGNSWTETDFVPGADWISVIASIGYEDDSGFADTILTDVKESVKNVNSSVYLRVPFTVEDPAQIGELFLDMKFDDGYIAYLNGSIIDIQNAPFLSGFDAIANSERPNDEALEFSRFEVTDFVGRLQPGENVLAIQGVNLSTADDDFLLAPRLSATVQSIDLENYGFFSSPTFGRINPNEFNVGPRISSVAHTPASPLESESIIVTAQVARTRHPVGNVELVYRTMYENEARITMLDSGDGEDSVADDGIYTAVIPSGIAMPGQMIRYFVEAADTEQNPMREPLIVDTTGRDQSPEYFGTIVRDIELEDADLPVLHWFAEDTRRARSRSGSRVSVYLNGEFYDNVFARQRGGATNNSSQKFNFNNDQPVYVNETIGRVEEFNLNAQGSDTTYLRQPLAFQSYTIAGNESSESFLMLMRDNGTADRVGVFIEQVDHVFLERQGLDPDGALYKFVQRQNLDPVFSDITTGIEKKTRLHEGLDDIEQVVDGLTQNSDVARANSVFDQFNLAQLMNYLAVRSVTQDADDVRKNFYLYRDTNGTGQWSIFPWDKDWTFGVTGDGGPDLSHPFFGDMAHWKPNANQWNRLYDTVFNDPVLSEMYLRRLRTVMDQMLQPPDTNPADGFYENLVDDVYAPASDYLRDSTQTVKNYFPPRRRTLYDDHSIDLLGGGEISDIIPEFSEAQYFVPTNNDLGLSWTGLEDPANIADWQTGPTGFGFERGETFSEFIKTEVKPTDACATCTSIYLRMPFDLNDPAELSALSLRLRYDDGFVAYINGVQVADDGLRAEPSFDVRARSRSNTVAAEFTNFNISNHINVLRPGRNVLAIHSVNSSVSSSDQLIVPVLIDGVISDSSAAGIPHAQMGNPTISFGSIEHNPSDDQDKEYIELKNENETAVDISGWRIDGGIRHEFPAGTVIPSGRSLFISPNVKAFLSRTEGPRGNQGLFVQGNYEGHLSNFGETLSLVTPGR